MSGTDYPDFSAGSESAKGKFDLVFKNYNEVLK